ncbi:MAG: ABC transporter substrate-binding protein, partial [Longimicrobiales bacterium]
VDGGALERSRPDLILTQAVCEVCAVPTPGVERVVAERGLDARVLSLDAHTVDEIFESMLAVGRAAGSAAAAERAVELLRTRIERVRQAVRGEAGPSVLAIEWLDPPFVPGHWVPEMVELAGGRNLAGETGAHSREISWGDIAHLDPDVLVIMPCGYGLDASIADADRHADRLEAVAPRAVAQRRAFAVDGSSYFNRSGPRVVDGIEILAGLLHPDRVPAPPAAAAAVWQPNAMLRYSDDRP